MEENISLIRREDIKYCEMEDAADIKLEGTHLTVVSLALEKLDKPITIICSEKYENFDNFWMSATIDRDISVSIDDRVDNS